MNFTQLSKNITWLTNKKVVFARALTIIQIETYLPPSMLICPTYSNNMKYNTFLKIDSKILKMSLTLYD